jgi:hypothetical protein
MKQALRRSVGMAASKLQTLRPADDEFDAAAADSAKHWTDKSGPGRCLRSVFLRSVTGPI